MKIGIVVGTRPEIIKMSPIIRECISDKDIEYSIIHTGQHYSFKMDSIFFQELEIPEPENNISVGSGSHASQTAKMLIGLEEAMLREDPDVVLVQGDTNSVLGASLICAKMHIPLGHVEAGLRSFDKRMPEEINRMVAGVCSDIHFAPTETAAINLFHSGVPRERVYVTGNTVVDACIQNSKIAEKHSSGFRARGKRNYILMTLHRPENVDVKQRFKDIIESVTSLGMEVIYPIHPRSKKMLNRFKIKSQDIDICDPMGYLEFLYTLSNARFAISDSGGVVEEAISMSVPCLSPRDDTDRPEAVENGGCILVGAEKSLITKYGKLLSKDTELFRSMKSAKNPYGDGRAGKKIISILKGLHNSEKLGINYLDMKKNGYPRFGIGGAKKDHLVFEAIKGNKIFYEGDRYKIIGPVERKIKRKER
jgi:UDP-N-acetylglucosamine 2-epimerase (non-hydrolysing)